MQYGAKTISVRSDIMLTVLIDAPFLVAWRNCGSFFVPQAIRLPRFARSFSRFLRKPANKQRGCLFNFFDYFIIFTLIDCSLASSITRPPCSQKGGATYSKIHDFCRDPLQEDMRMSFIITLRGSMVDYDIFPEWRGGQLCGNSS